MEAMEAMEALVHLGEAEEVRKSVMIPSPTDTLGCAAPVEWRDCFVLWRDTLSFEGGFGAYDYGGGLGGVGYTDYADYGLGLDYNVRFPPSPTARGYTPRVQAGLGLGGLNGGGLGGGLGGGFGGGGFGGGGLGLGGGYLPTAGIGGVGVGGYNGGGLGGGLNRGGLGGFNGGGVGCQGKALGLAGVRAAWAWLCTRRELHHQLRRQLRRRPAGRPPAPRPPHHQPAHHPAPALPRQLRRRPPPHHRPHPPRRPAPPRRPPHCQSLHRDCDYRVQPYPFTLSPPTSAVSGFQVWRLQHQSTGPTFASLWF